MKIEQLDIKKIKVNPSNPRIIKDEKFHKLVKSIQDFPQMLEIRPIVVNEDMVIIGGNMRYRAAIEAGFKKIPVIKVSNLTEEQQKEFIVKDNVAFGEWDFDLLANEWDKEFLIDWGIDIPNFDKDVNLDEFFEEKEEQEKIEMGKIVLEYTLEEAEKVKAELLKHDKTPEQAVYKLLGL